MASPSAKAAAAKKTGPKTLDIVIEAIKAVDDRKGVSIQAIKAYVLENYPDKDPNMIKTSLKKAIQKGFEEELIIRPTKSEITGPSMSGRLKLNKAKMADIEKGAKAKAKKAEKKAEAEKSPATKKKSAAAKKTKATASKKSPATKKSPKKKAETTKEKAAKTKSPKSPKSPVKSKKTVKAVKTPAKSQTKAKKVTKTPMKTSKSVKTKGKAK